MALQNNISSANVLPAVLLSAGDNVNAIESISIANTHATDSVDVDLFIDSNSLGTYYIIKSLTIPNGVSLVLDENLDFDNTSSGYSLYIKLSAADSTVDVLVKKKK
jgi:hypothetical protein